MPDLLTPLERLALPDALILDTETTGLGSDAQVIEIAILDLTGCVLLDTLVRPTIPVPLDATVVHGLDDDALDGAPAFPDVWPQLADLLTGRLVLAYNADFDRRLLQQTATLHGLELPAVGFRCLMEWATRHLNRRRWLSLDRAAFILGCECGEPRHRALGDARTALAILQVLTETH